MSRDFFYWTCPKCKKEIKVSYVGEPVDNKLKELYKQTKRCLECIEKEEFWKQQTKALN